MKKPRRVLVSCPKCGERRLGLGDGKPSCSKCGWSASAEKAADAYAHAGDSDWKDPKHGPDDETGTCEYCSDDAVVPVQEKDLVGQVQRKLGVLWRRLKLESGAGDAGFSICFNCGELHYGMPQKDE